MSLSEYRKKLESEPVGDGVPFLKADKVKAGDMVKVEKVEIDAEKHLDNGDVIPAKPVVTGPFIASGQNPGQDVKVSINKTTAKKLFALWGEDWVGGYLLVSATPSKNIKGENRQWIDWAPMPKSLPK